VFVVCCVMIDDEMCVGGVCGGGCVRFAFGGEESSSRLCFYFIFYYGLGIV
jgi:hypothetical protein